MKTKIFLIVLLNISIIAQIKSQVGQLTVGEPFDLKSFKTLEGQTYSLDPIQNKILVMNFWNIGCRGCELERPYLNNVFNKYKNSDVLFWSITLNTEKKLESFLEKHPIDWEIKGGVDFMGIAGDETFLIKCMPTTIIVDKERKILYSKCGAIMEGKTGDDFEKLINEALNN